MSVSQVVPVAGFALSGMAQAIKALYHVVGEINEFIDDHIEKLKASDSPLIASTGRVLEAAKYGFGVGYMSSVAIMAVGQFLLGNTLVAVVTVATAATLTNPIAMTCGALGAIYYGWNALTDKERRQILESLASGLTMGIELIRSLVEFVIRKSRDLMETKQLEDFKEYVKTQAALFGRSLSDITRKVGDAVLEGFDKAGDVLKDVAEKTGDALKGVADKTGEVLKEGKEKAGELLNEGVEATKDWIGRSQSQAEGASSTTLTPAPPNASSDATPAGKSAPPKDQS